MKFSSSFLCFIFCTLQVHLALSDEKSWNEKFKILDEMREDVLRAADDFVVYVLEENNFVHEEIYRRVIRLTEIMTNASISKLEEIKSIVRTSHCNNVRPCVIKAYHTMSDEVSENSKIMTRLADFKIKNITVINKSHKLDEMLKEIRSIMNSESDRNTSSCLKEHKLFGPSELCLTIKMQRVHLLLKTFDGLQEHMKIKKASALHDDVEYALNEIHVKHMYQLTGVAKVKNDFSGCILQTCKTAPKSPRFLEFTIDSKLDVNSNNL